MSYALFCALILIGTVAPRIASLAIDYLVLLLLLRANDVSLKKLFTLNRLKIAILVLTLIIPLVTGVFSSTFSLYQLARFLVGFIPFLIFTLIISDDQQKILNPKRYSLSNNSTLQFISIAVTLCGVLYLIFPDAGFPVYISQAKDLSYMPSSQFPRIYPLGVSSLCALAAFHRQKNGIIFILCAFVAILLTQGRTVTILVLIALLIPYQTIIRRAFQKQRLHKNIIILILALLLAGTLAPWSRSNLLANQLVMNSTRNIMSMDAVSKTLSNPISSVFGLGFGTKSNGGYYLITGASTDSNSKLVINSEYSTENFYGSSISRFGILGSIFTLYLILSPSLSRITYLAFFCIVGLGSGIIEDSSMGTFLVVTYIAHFYRADKKLL